MSIIIIIIIIIIIVKLDWLGFTIIKIILRILLYW